MTAMTTISNIRDMLWSGPFVTLLVIVGVWQTLQLKGLQFRYLGKALRMIFKNKKNLKARGDISSFQSLMTALAGAIGTGNIAGIATAVAVGGFGSLFWMWVIAFLGMATAYSEALLAVKYRVANAENVMAGGPMYTLERGLKNRKLAIIYALFGSVAALGLGNLVQANSVAHAISSVFPVSHIITGIVMMIVTGSVILGGISTIGRVAGFLVPFMALMYLGAGLFILGWHYDRLIPAFQLIFSSAFTGQAATGGFLGSSMILAIQYGVSKGVFSNEAGLGSLAIAAASAKVKSPAEQGFFAISGVFISTMLVCTITGLVLAVTGVLGLKGADGHLLTGSSMAMFAFNSVIPGMEYIVLLGLILFAFTTVLAWGYYGEKCVEYLFGLKFAHYYRWIYTIIVMIGAVLKLELVWALSDIANGFMAIPNLLSVLFLSKIVKQETHLYLANETESKMEAVEEMDSDINLKEIIAEIEGV